MKIARWVILAALVVSQSALALSTIEFMKMEPIAQMQVIKPIMLRFLSRGFKRVPSNEFTLIGRIEKIAYEKGYTFQNIETVAEEAAVSLGMER